MEIFKIENLSFSYPQSKKNVLNDISFTIEEGSFNIICGATGSGKTTLLKMLKNEITPKGKRNGNIYYYGKEISSLTKEESARNIGFVFQNPDNQIVSDKVYSELSFGLENIKTPHSVMHRRIAEMASFFNLNNLFNKDTSLLSGGEKQLLNLASIMVMEPKVLLLDEATSQLDPISSYDFLKILKKINDELATTIILVEHNLEDAISLADNLIIIEEGKVVLKGRPLDVCSKIIKVDKTIDAFHNFPSAVRIFKECLIDGCPLNVKDARTILLNHDLTKVTSLKHELKELNKEKVISLKNVSFKYKKIDDYIISKLSLDVYKGEVLSIVGSNGCGKTTLLNLICANLKALEGSVIVNQKNVLKYKDNELYKNNLVVLPQNPDDLFICETVLEELEEMKRITQDEDFSIKLSEITEELKIKELYKMHPYDLSGGEKQKVALAKILLLNPSIILLDEPSKGLDGANKLKLAKIIKKLQEKEITIVIVTHDLEFSSLVSDECALLFNGEIVCKSDTLSFFSGNTFYTTAVARITKGIFNRIITVNDAVEIIKANLKI